MKGGGHLAILRSGFGATKESEVPAGDIVPVSCAQFEETLASASPDVLRATLREFAQQMMDADVEVTSAEEGAGWLAFLRGLADRGLSGVALVISDDRTGLVNALAAATARRGLAALPGPQRRNLLTWVPKTAQPWVLTLVRMIFEQPDAASVRAQHAQVVVALEAKLPQAAAHLDQAPRRHPGLHLLPESRPAGHGTK
jgi:transposase-like protein